MICKIWWIFSKKNCKKISWIYCRKLNLLQIWTCWIGLQKMRQQHFVDEPTFDFHQHIRRTYTETSYFHPRSEKKGGFMHPLGQWEKGSLLESSSALVLRLSIVLHFRSYKCDSCWWPKCEWDLTIEPDCEKNYYFTWKNYPLGLLLFE